jgi:hypothetical protein
MNSLYVDIGHKSLSKFGESLCGDTVEIVDRNDGEVVIVLADGLGSGVKASILSTLTAKIIAKMMAESLSIEECVYAVAATLPVCELRKIAYSTFTVICITKDNVAEILQYDNPHVILLRNGKHFEFERTSLVIEDKLIYRSSVPLHEDDILIAVSDGALNAGVGKTLNFGWQRSHIIAFVEGLYHNNYSAKAHTTALLEQCELLYKGEPGDDTTVCTVRLQGRKLLNLMIGPPADPADVSPMMSQFFSKQGKHIVCGGTTSMLAAEHLGKELVTDLNYIDPKIPPIGKIEGVELVTEGVITTSQVLVYARDYLDKNELYADWRTKKDGASMIARLLFEEATDVNFFVGLAMNSAHQNSNLPIDFNIKMKLVDDLSKSLEEMGKRVQLSYF